MGDDMVKLRIINYKLKNFFSLKRILILLVLTLIFLDFILLISFILINPQLSLPAQLFGFFSSHAFQILTAYFLVPIIVLLFENIFKINEKRIEEKKARQIDSINKTQDLWSDLAKITAEFIYSKEFGLTEISALKIEIEKFIVKAEEALNAHYFDFKNLEKVLGKDNYYTSTILIPMSILESSISSSLTSIIKGETDIAPIQEYIRIIYNGVKAATHHRTINIMKYSMALNDSYDKKYEDKIKDEYNYLNRFNFVLIKEIFDNYEFDISDTDYNDINSYLNEIKHTDYDPNLSLKSKKEFENLYKKLPNRKQILLNDIHEFPDDLIKNLAHIIKVYDLNANLNHFHNDYTILKNYLEK